jgi:nicotinic acid mononucleotide adenylyltransferase
MTAFPSIQELTELVNGFKEPFRLVWSSKSGEWKPSGDLIIMDASYNPPSRAHQDLAETALKQYGSSPSTELLLLFATVNATKAAAAKPLVPQRLAMMHQMAQDIAQESSTPISIALTSEPLFPRKAHIIHQSLPACRLKFIIGWE